MTTEQAIKVLNGGIKKPNIINGYLGQALTMGIDALKNQPVRCKNCVQNCVHFDGRPCGIVDLYNTEDDFCSKGKRKL